jgi:uncharacterized membrane protein YccF (DUF307 family)
MYSNLALVFVLELLATMLVFGVWLFFLIHAVQYVEDPITRTAWVLCIIAFNLFGAAIYAITKYREFSKQGKARLLRKGKDVPQVTVTPR